VSSVTPQRALISRNFFVALLGFAGALGLYLHLRGMQLMTHRHISVVMSDWPSLLFCCYSLMRMSLSWFIRSPAGDERLLVYPRWVPKREALDWLDTAVHPHLPQRRLCRHVSVVYDISTIQTLSSLHSINNTHQFRFVATYTVVLAVGGFLALILVLLGSVVLSPALSLALFYIYLEVREWEIGDVLMMCVYHS